MVLMCNLGIDSKLIGKLVSFLLPAKRQLKIS
jgi:hypothetical protein